MFFAKCFWLLVLLEAAVVWQGVLAWHRNMLTPWTMINRGARFEKGLPFLAHGGMWGDVFIISPLVAMILARYGSTWSKIGILIAVIVGTICSFWMHETYLKAQYPEAHVQFGRLTGAGRVHEGYMIFAIAVFLLFYFGTPHPSRKLLWITSCLLTVHVALGTHVILGIVKPTWYGGDPLHSWGTWLPIIGVATATFWRTWYLVL